MTAACSDPQSDACKAAQQEVAAAQEKVQEAEAAVESANNEVAFAEDAVNVSRDELAAAQTEASAADAATLSANAANAKAKMDAACVDPESDACKQATEAYNQANLEDTKAKARAACDADPESEACKAAKEAFNQAYDAVDADKQAAADAAAQEAINAAQSDADAICQEKGRNSQECQEAMDKVMNLTCNGDTACETEFKYGAGVAAATRRLKTTEPGGMGVVDISQSRTIGDSGPYSLGGYRSQYFNYDGGGDVLEKVTRRAALVVVSLKPIVYIFAGFGLIAFAWMAIFNKLSWKWFANIAMGLFLVANMGRLIEYFVGQEDQYYIGVWDSNTSGTGGSADSRLANAFADTYYVYGDTDYNDVGVRAFKDKEAEVAAQGDVTAETITEEEARKFCQKDAEASGWSNFTSCIKDIVSTAKKVANTAKTVASTAQDVYARYENVKDNVANIKQAVQAMEGASLTNIIANVGTILNNVNSAVSTTTGTVGALTGAASNISNNIQDMGKSVEQQQELQDRRNLGEATNAVDAALKGQSWDKENKEVVKEDQQVVDPDTGEVLTGSDGKPLTEEVIKTDDNFLTGLQDTANDIGNKSSELNNLAQDGIMQAGTITNVVEDFSIGGSQSINDRRQERQAQEAAEQHAQELAAAEEEYRNSNAGINAAYQNQADETSRLYDNIQSQQSEVEQLKEQQKQAEEAYNNAYSQANDAADRLASYTNEDVNKTGDSRLNSSEDIDNQMLINQYLSETSPDAVAQSAKNNYIEQKNKTDAAKNSLTEKQGVAEQTRSAYEEAAADVSRAAIRPTAVWRTD